MSFTTTLTRGTHLSTRGMAFRRLDRYPDGQTLPRPSAIDFTPGELLGSVSGELGLRHYLEAHGHELVVTSDKDGTAPSSSST